jgi:hypothetical protein
LQCELAGIGVKGPQLRTAAVQQSVGPEFAAGGRAQQASR